MDLNWEGAAVNAEIEQRLKGAVAEIALRIEAKAKTKLQPSQQVKGRFVKGGGRGLRTGTLRRSIHADKPSGNFGSDNVAAGAGTPERGGQEPTPERDGTRLMAAVGSGLGYAMYVHQGHYNPEVQGFITRSAEEVMPQALSIVRRHVAG